MQPQCYLQMAIPQLIAQCMKPAACNGATATMSKAAIGYNWFDFNAWNNMFASSPQADSETAAS